MRSDSFGEGSRSFLDRLIMWVRLRKIIPLIAPDSAVLDLGCGYSGELLMSLKNTKRRVGIDLSVGDNAELELVQGRVDHPLSLPGNSFDVVTALAIIEHVEDPTTMLSEIQRVLKPGGRVLITTPSLAGKFPLETMARLGLISREEIADHKRYYTRLTLTEAMEQAGLKNVRVRHFGLAWMNLHGEGSK